jgi:hypothetical protein
MQGKFVNVKSIEEDGIEDVYCLSVPQTKNFVTNGILSHNCDALRYALYTHKVPVYDPYKKKEGPDDYLNNRFGQSSRFH